MTPQTLPYATTLPSAPAPWLARVAFALALGPLAAGIMVWLACLTISVAAVRIVCFLMLGMGALSSLVSVLCVAVLLWQARRFPADHWYDATRAARIVIIMLVFAYVSAGVFAMLGLSRFSP